jgi:hypothetical protein
MKNWLWRCAVVLLIGGLSAAALGQRGGAIPPPPGATSAPGDDTKLPNGKSQRDEILKQEHDQNVKDAAQLSDLAQQLQQDLEKEDRYVLSMATLKKTEDIEKLARKIRSRLRHN